VVVLKGAFSIIAAPRRSASINPFATPALATAGSGDVLAGLITGLLAQGVAPFEAAVCGCYLHGLAGELAGREFGPATIAGDVLRSVPGAFGALASRRQDMIMSIQPPR
jgi:NAD(P)H-hydrate epimerase